MAQWIRRICLPLQRTWVQSLDREDSTCHGATKPVHQLSSRRSRAHELQLLQPMDQSPCSIATEAMAKRSLSIPTRENSCKDGMGREVGGGLRMGNTCTPMVDSCQSMAKPLHYCKVISLQLNKFIFKN